MNIRVLTRFFVFAALAIFPSSDQAQQPLQVLHRHVLPVVSNGQAALVGPLPQTQRLNLAIVLPLRDQSELTSLLNRLYDPSSPDYRQFLSVDQFTEQFGPTAEDYQAVIDFAQANGLTVTDRPANRRLVSINGSIGQINKVFHVNMNVYRHPTENRTFFSPDREPSLNLRVPVAHIAGLNNYSLPHPANTVSGSAPDGSYLSSDMRAAYYTSTLSTGATPLTGQGQIVGLYAANGYNINDVNTYFSTAGKTNNVPIVNVLLDGLTGTPISGGLGSSYEFEIELDIEMVLGMAPGLSQLRVYEGVNPEDILNAMASENLAKQLSTSVTWSQGTNDDVFMEFAAQGQSFFSASGDGGAKSSIYPAEDPWVTAVGGTALFTNGASGPWLSETAWSSSGGGPSPGYAIPSYQAELNGVNGASTTQRNVPDVAMNATDVYFCSFGSCSDSGGTSASSPLWAGFMALVNQQAAAAGEPPLGFLNPYIYAIGEGPNYNSDFHDITIGNNDCCGQSIFYNAGSGYDLVTGWGSPNGQNLINDLAPQAGPKAPSFTLSASPGYLTIYTGSIGTSTITVNGWGGFTGSVNLSVSGLPSGVTATWSTNPTTGTSVLKLAASSSANTNTVNPTLLTITGTSGTLTATIYINLAISPEPTNPPEGYVTSSLNFAAEEIGTQSAPQTLTFTFNTADTLGSLSVLTQGAAGLDFANAGKGSCAANTGYSASQTCTVNVIFTPSIAGTRYGAVVLNGTNGKVIATGYLQGTGVGPQINFLPSTESTVASQSSSKLNNPSAVAVDGSGNVYIADTGNNRILKETWSAGSYIQSTIPTSSLNSPGGVAVDGAGNIYIADTDNQRVLKETPTSGGYTESVIASFPLYSGNWILSVAVDGSGNVYFSSGAEIVYVETLSAGNYTQSNLQTSSSQIGGLAVDGGGNIYVADLGNKQILIEVPSAGGYTESTVSISGPVIPNPMGVAVDAMGNIYIPIDYVVNSTLYSAVLKEALSAGSYTQSTIATSPLDRPSGVAVDGSGNVYIVDDGDFIVLKEDFTDPPSLAFAATDIGSTSSDSPLTVTVENTGNAALIFPVPATGNNPSITTNFTWNSSATSACPLVESGSSTVGTLAAGASCLLPVTFAPVSANATSGLLVLKDNNLNAVSPGYATQSIKISGTVLALATSTVLSINPSSNTLAAGSSYTLTATVTPSSGSVTPSGNVLFTVGSATKTVALNSSGIATYTGTAPTTAGSLTLSAAYQGSTLFFASNSNTLNETVVIPSFAIVGTSVTVAPGATTANTSTITVTPSGGFTGSVALTATITSSPAGAQYPPTLSFGSTTSVNITGSNSGTAILTVSTTAASIASLANPMHHGFPWYSEGGAALACILLFGFPAQRSRWRTKLGMLTLLITLTGGVIACSSVSVGGGSNPGTTAGAYTITVTGTSGITTATNAVTLNVQ